MKKLMVLLCLLIGCARREGAPSVEENGEDRVMLLAIGTDDDRELDFAARLVEGFVRTSPQDKLVIARLGAAAFLAWEGRSADLKKLCPSKQELKALLKRSEPTKAVPLYASLRDCLRFVIDGPRVQAGRAKPLVFVLSSMVDDGTTFQDKCNLTYFIGEVGYKRGEMRVYFADPSKVAYVTRWIAQMHVQKSAVFSSAQSQPPVPGF